MLADLRLRWTQLRANALIPLAGHADGTGSKEQGKEQPGTMDDGLNVVKEGWFTELSSMWPGQGLSLEVKEVLFRERSKFQVSAKCALGWHAVED